MTDPHIPVERGLRATVRMAAGINTGDRPDQTSLAERLRETLHGLRDDLADRFGLVSDLAATLRAPAVLRRAVQGAAAGSALVVLGFAGLAAEAALTASPAPEPRPEVVLRVEEAAAKADRAAVGMKLASLGVPDGSVVSGIDVVIAQDDEASTTTATPVLAYASAEIHAGNGLAAIDRVLEAPPVAAAPAAPIILEEEDDEAVEPLALPMPRARPQVDAEALSLPLPRPRPRILASLGQPGTDDVAPPGVSEPTARPAEAPRPAPSNALGFFSSPTEPMKAPSRTPIETPFGVPYVLQTGSVETACIKPELVDILRRIEGHYRQKVVITSGFRDRGRQGSLHRQCAAVDIQVPGVDAAALAAFARTLPSIGGVGTYCHPHMIHVDIGTPRDWKYGCGSFFAMRGAPGKWGKVPGTMAKAQTGSPPSQVVSDAEEE